MATSFSYLFLICSKVGESSAPLQGMSTSCPLPGHFLFLGERVSFAVRSAGSWWSSLWSSRALGLCRPLPSDAEVPTIHHELGRKVLPFDGVAGTSCHRLARLPGSQTLEGIRVFAWTRHASCARRAIFYCFGRRCLSLFFFDQEPGVQTLVHQSTQPINTTTPEIIAQRAFNAPTIGHPLRYAARLTVLNGRRRKTNKEKKKEKKGRTLKRNGGEKEKKKQTRTRVALSM